MWDGEPGCAHEWGDVNRVGGGKQDVDGKRWQHTDGGVSGHGHAASAFCRLCGTWLGAHGLEPTPELYVQHEVQIFREVRRVLRKDGTCWINLGDSYIGGGRGGLEGAGHGSLEEGRYQRGQRIGQPTGRIDGYKAKDLVGIPWMVAFALRADGWYLRSDIIWSKPNPMPESVTDRPSKSHEYVFLLSKSAKYFYDAEAIKEDVTGGTHSKGPHYHPMAKTVEMGKGIKNNESFAAATWEKVSSRNRRTVWTIATEPYPEAHFATFPRKLVQPCILAGCPEHACPKCGAPWVREVGEPVAVEGRGSGNVTRKPGEDSIPGASHVGRGFPWQPTARATIGEHPTCTCGLAPIGGTVLDPFGGSGTVGEVALEYGRQAILIELKPEYVELQKRRLAPVAGRPMLDFAALRAEEGKP